MWGYSNVGMVFDLMPDAFGMKNMYKVFLVLVFNVWNDLTSGTLVVPTFQEASTIFFTTVAWGSNPGRWHGKPKVHPLGQKRSQVFWQGRLTFLDPTMLQSNS